MITANRNSANLTVIMVYIVYLSRVESSKLTVQSHESDWLLD